MSTYAHRPWRVAAIEWTGGNFADVERFLVDNLGEDCGPRNEPDNGYNIVRFEAWGDDQEVDPGRVIVVHLDVENEGEIMYPDDFRTAYESAGGSQ